MCAISDFYDFSGASRFHKKHRKNIVPNVHTFECKDNEITKWLQSSIQGHRTYTKTFIDYNVLGPKMSWEQFYWQGCGHSAFSGQDSSHNSYANRKYLTNHKFSEIGSPKIVSMLFLKILEIVYICIKRCMLTQQEITNGDQMCSNGLVYSKLPLRKRHLSQKSQKNDHFCRKGCLFSWHEITDSTKIYRKHSEMTLGIHPNRFNAPVWDGSEPGTFPVFPRVINFWVYYKMHLVYSMEDCRLQNKLPVRWKKSRNSNFPGGLVLVMRNVTNCGPPKCPST